MKIKAIFKGKDNSLGYSTNKEYILSIRPSDESNKGIFISTGKDVGECMYSNLFTFLDNWDNIRKL
jgi:hypothetical protein